MEEDTNSAEPAILVRGVSKRYGNDDKVLDNLDMTVIRGTIYSLLGASGCGKTTLLSSILGSRKIQNGSISILGLPPGVIPVKSIGYMPQDIALVGELSIENVLQHQGWIFGMSDKQIKERHKFCEKLLDLPPANKLIKNLSGGQQRRVSLAVVLIHDPQLLILDEPTVGLDPVLRQNLWDYLTKITKEEKKTVVITTHYIEEAKQATMVGMLRHGKMIAEGEPQILLSQYNCSSLEELFVSLSVKQEEKESSQQQNLLISKSTESMILGQRAPQKSLSHKVCFLNRGHVKALLSKNFIRYVRHPGTLFPTLCIPIVQVAAAFIAIGNIPGDLKIGIVNEELGIYKNCEDYISANNITKSGHVVDEFGTCEYEGLGCKFAGYMENLIRNQVYFESIEEALKAVKDRKINQILFFPHNYSEAFTIVSNFNDVEPKDVDFSKIVFYKDDADNPLGLYVEKELYNSYRKLAEGLADDCNWKKRSAKLPLLFNEPIYGHADLTFNDFIAPGIMAICIAFLPKALAIITIIDERTAGVWERTITSGVRPVEILLCHMLTLSFTSAIQCIECFLVAFYVFGFECQGSVVYAVALLFSIGVVGVALGTLLSVVCKKEMPAIFAALGIAYPMFIVSGCVWPIESQPTIVRYMSYYFAPTTIPVESLNNIIFRGWGITNFNVYKGYLVAFVYISVCSILSVIGLKFEKT